MPCKSADLCKTNLAVKVTPGQKKKYGKLNKKVLIMSLFVDEDLEKIDIFQVSLLFTF